MGYLNEDGLATLVGKVKGQVVQLTSAEYRNLPDTKNSDNKTYFVTDEDYAYAIDDEPTLNSDNLVKSGGVYTYTSKIGSGTLETTAQTIIPAINELDAAIDTINTGLTSVEAASIKQLTMSSGNLNDVEPNSMITYGYGAYPSIVNRPFDKGAIILTLGRTDSKIQIAVDRTNASLSNFSIRTAVDSVWCAWKTVSIS